MHYQPLDLQKQNNVQLSPIVQIQQVLEGIPSELAFLISQSAQLSIVLF